MAHMDDPKRTEFQKKNHTFDWWCIPLIAIATATCTNQTLNEIGMISVWSLALCFHPSLRYVHFYLLIHLYSQHSIDTMEMQPCRKVLKSTKVCQSMGHINWEKRIPEEQLTMSICQNLSWKKSKFPPKNLFIEQHLELSCIYLHMKNSLSSCL